MIYDDRDRIRVRNAVLVVTALGWVLSVWTPAISTPSIGTAGMADAHAHHHAMNRSADAVVAAANWLLMLAAMMAPVLIHPIQFVRGSSLARQRTRSTMLFVAGYTVVWMIAGAFLLTIAQALGSYGIPPYAVAAAVFCIALVWQCSPAKQVCLNRCHALRGLAAFGPAADADALFFGATHGVWCAGSCWAWMLLPLLVPGGHIAAMAGATVLIFCERLENPARVCWRWRGLGKARRIVAGRLRMV